MLRDFLGVNESYSYLGRYRMYLPDDDNDGAVRSRGSANVGGLVSYPCLEGKAPIAMSVYDKAAEDSTFMVEAVYN